jgi:alpha-tubulin suppressor-like RCC1 family protein
MGILAQPPATVQESAVPLRIMSASGTPMQFGAFDTGNHFVLGISNRKVYGWGQNLFNQLGEIPNVNTPVPTEIPLPAGVTPVRVSAGVKHGCVLSDAGRIYCWGSGSNTIILGRPSSDTSPPEHPAEVPHPESIPWDSVSIGEGHACAIDTLQNLYCWGQNDNFQLGSPMGNTSTPTRVPVDLQFSAVSTGPRGTCARTTSRAIYCWGVNTGHVLGLPDVDAIVMTPTRVCLPAP